MNKFAGFFAIVAFSLFSAGFAFAAGYQCAKCYTSCNQGYHRCSGSAVTGTPCTTSTGTSSCAACVPCAGTEYDANQSCGCPTGQHWTGSACTVNCQPPMEKIDNECAFFPESSPLTLKDSVGTLTIPSKMKME
ncbi:MAG: hypothetical protein LBK26_01950 [Rickettsiales bacterium]|jgi:hypothetical protein|nr:hypothetical protein [Rickettsiales bacterium]